MPAIGGWSHGLRPVSFDTSRRSQPTTDARTECEVVLHPEPDIVADVIVSAVVDAVPLPLPRLKKRKAKSPTFGAK
jgi:hypothetical protein